MKNTIGGSGCLERLFWIFLILIVLPIASISIFPPSGKWSKGKSFEEFQTYFPTKYIFPTKEKLCFKNKSTSRDDCRYFCDQGQCDHDQVTLPILLDGEASKKRLIEIAKEVYKDFPDRKIILVFFIKGGDLQLGRIYNISNKYYAFAKASFPKNTYEENIKVEEFFWNPDEFKHVLNKLKTNLERKNEILLGSSTICCITL